MANLIDESVSMARSQKLMFIGLMVGCLRHRYVTARGVRGLQRNAAASAAGVTRCNRATLAGRNATIRPWVTSTFKRAVRVSHNRTGVTHRLIKGQQKLDIVPATHQLCDDGIGKTIF